MTSTRAFATRHTVPSLGYTLIDRRQKLRKDLLEQNLPNHVIRQMKERGEQITYRLDVPMVVMVLGRTPARISRSTNGFTAA